MISVGTGQWRTEHYDIVGAGQKRTEHYDIVAAKEVKILGLKLDKL